MINREEVIEKQFMINCWIETIPTLKPEGMINTMSDIKNKIEEVFDIEIELPTSKGKACHMQVDEDLHSFLNQQRIKINCSFRELANKILCTGIQSYIVAKKLPNKIKNRTK